MVQVLKTTLSGENQEIFDFEDPTVAVTFFDLLVDKYKNVLRYNPKFDELNCKVFEVPSPAWDQIELRMVRV